MKRLCAALVAGGVLLVALLSGCVSTDLLSEYRFEDRTLGARLLTPPSPRVSANYDMHVDRNDPVGSVLRVGTGLAVAVQVQQTQEKLTRVLQAVSVPEEIRREALDRVAEVLGCDQGDDGARSDYLLVLEIEEYGIQARNWNAEAEFHVDMRISLRDREDGTEIWRRHVSESAPVSQAFPWGGGAVRNVLTVLALSELTDEEIGRGMMVLAQRVADKAAQRLEHDLERAGVF